MYIYYVLKLFYFSENGANIKLMKKAGIKERFPWLNVEDIELATYGMFEIDFILTCFALIMK